MARAERRSDNVFVRSRARQRIVDVFAADRREGVAIVRARFVNVLMNRDFALDVSDLLELGRVWDLLGKQPASASPLVGRRESERWSESD
jgi:hypothetical protein